MTWKDAGGFATWWGRIHNFQDYLGTVLTKTPLEPQSFEHGIAKTSQNCQRATIHFPRSPTHPTLQKDRGKEQQKPNRKERGRKWSYVSESALSGDCHSSPSPSPYAERASGRFWGSSPPLLRPDLATLKVLKLSWGPWPPWNPREQWDPMFRIPADFMPHILVTSAISSPLPIRTCLI